MFERIMSLITGIFLLTSLSCGKSADATVPADTSKPKGTDTSTVNEKFGMPFYYNFISTMKKQGYVFWDFEKFYYADKSKLPQKLIVIRHDIHGRDIEGAVKANEIEKNLLGKRVATYFVQWNDPTEMSDLYLQQQYLDFINLLKKDTVDVQPHISANDLYLYYDAPSWKDKDVTALKSIFDECYEINVSNDSSASGIGTTIKVKTKDSMNLKGMNERMIEVLKIYNSKWETATGLKPRYYASHGSHAAINYVLNNQVILDQLSLLHSGAYLFDTYNTWIANYLTYLSDNSIPSWIGNPSEVKPGRYQLLMHPWVWDNYARTMAIRQAASAAAAHAVAKPTDLVNHTPKTAAVNKPKVQLKK
ncbi:MAG: hypothetical protein Q8908_00445 [Bacteroidota bacterium]|nr:hypothetical protein [Bacteroidota bacterium]